MAKGMEFTITTIVIIIIFLALLVVVATFFTKTFPEASRPLKNITDTTKEKAGDHMAVITGRCPEGKQWVLHCVPGISYPCTTYEFGRYGRTNCTTCRSYAIREAKDKTVCEKCRCE